MIVRRLLDSDLPRLREMAEASGFPYTDPKAGTIEAVLILADADNKPVMAIAAERIAQLYLWIDPNLGPVQAFCGLRQFHEKMPEVLAGKGYAEANAFLPPALERNFGRRLERSFGWKKNWTSWFRTF